MKTPDTEIAKTKATKPKANIENKNDKNFVDTSYNSEVTQEDLQVLGQDFQNNMRQDGGDDSQLKSRSENVDFAGKELDVPGRNAASNNTTNRITDEENKLHSQGSTSNENLEEQSSQYTR